MQGLVRTKYHIGCRQLSRKAHSNVGCVLEICWWATFYWVFRGKVDWGWGITGSKSAGSRNGAWSKRHGEVISNFEMIMRVCPSASHPLGGFQASQAEIVHLHADRTVKVSDTKRNNYLAIMVRMRSEAFWASSAMFAITSTNRIKWKRSTGSFNTTKACLLSSYSRWSASFSA
jgi:hypothetical protein